MKVSASVPNDSADDPLRINLSDPRAPIVGEEDISLIIDCDATRESKVGLDRGPSIPVSDSDLARMASNCGYPAGCIDLPYLRAGGRAFRNEQIPDPVNGDPVCE
jgi:hypothetical protein